MRMLPTRANGQPAYGLYMRRPTGEFTPFHLQVLTLGEGPHGEPRSSTWPPSSTITLFGLRAAGAAARRRLRLQCPSTAAPLEASRLWRSCSRVAWPACSVLTQDCGVDLARPTPCRDFDLATLLLHLAEGMDTLMTCPAGCRCKDPGPLRSVCDLRGRCQRMLARLVPSPRLSRRGACPAPGGCDGPAPRSPSSVDSSSPCTRGTWPGRSTPDLPSADGLAADLSWTPVLLEGRRRSRRHGPAPPTPPSSSASSPPPAATPRWAGRGDVHTAIHAGSIVEALRVTTPRDVGHLLKGSETRCAVGPRSSSAPPLGHGVWADRLRGRRLRHRDGRRPGSSMNFGLPANPARTPRHDHRDRRQRRRPSRSW